MLKKRDLRGLCKAISKFGKYDDEVIQAFEALVEIGEDAVEPLITILKDANKSRWRTRFRISSQLASQALGRIGDARAVEPLIETFKKMDDYLEVKGSIAEALGRIGDARAVEPLIGALNEPVIRLQVANALGMIGEAAFGPLAKALETLGDGERSYVVDIANRAFVEKKGFAPSHLMGISDSPKVSAEPRIQLDSSGKIEISNANFNAIFGESYARTVAKEKEVQKQPEVADAQKFMCSECGEEIPNAIPYEPPDLSMCCSGIARQCSCGWTCCLRCDPTYDQSDNGHDCPQCGQRRTGWVRWDPHRNMVDRSGWTLIEGDTDHWLKGGLWRRWKEDRDSDRWTTLRRALAKRLNI